MKDLLAKLDEMEKRANAAAPPDCGDNSCWFATAKGGMRTNGGCRCYDRSDLAGRRYATLMHASRTDIPKLIAALRRAVEGLEKYRCSNCDRGYADCMGYIACEALADIEKILHAGKD